MAEKRTDEHKSPGINRKSVSEVFEERVKVETEGDMYHPNFLLYNAAIGLGLAQQTLDSDDESGYNNVTLKEYNVFAQLLRAKSLPSTVYLNRTEDLIARQFLGSLQTESVNSGFSLAWKSKDWPMRFQYDTSETKQDTLASMAEDFFRRDSERYKYSLSHDFSELSRMRFEYDRDEITQGNLGTLTDIVADRYTLMHDLTIGDKKQHRLGSFFNYLDQKGAFPFKFLQWDEQLRLRHTPDFLTNYEFRFSESQRETSKNKQSRGQVGFEHSLFESLVTRGNVFLVQTDLDSQGELKQHGGSIAFSYQKKNPWGLLLSTYSTSRINSDQSGGAGTGIVTDESHVFTDPLPITLDRVNINTSSIVVTDSTGLNVYTLGDDYTISEVNGRTRLNLTTLGTVPPNIADGQTILVDYIFVIEPERKEKILRHNFTVRQRFNNFWSLYYAHQRQNQKISSNTTEIMPDEFRINTFGAEYAKKNLFLMAEYSKESSTQIPSTSKRLECRYSWLLNRDTTINLRASGAWLDFGEPDSRDVSLFSSGGEIFSRLANRLSISTRLDYRDEDDSRFGVTRGFQLNSELHYKHRQLSIIAGVELDMLKRRESETDGYFFYLRLKRLF